MSFVGGTQSTARLEDPIETEEPTTSNMDGPLSINASANVELRRSFMWRTLAAAAGMASTLLLTVVIVRTLDPHEAATFFAVLVALSFGSMIGCLGMGPNVIRLMAAEPDPVDRRKIAGTHLQATFLLSCLSAPFIALVSCNGLLGHSIFLPACVLTTFLIVIESTRLMISNIFTAAGRVHASVATMHYVRSLLALPFVVLAVFAISQPSLLVVLGTYLAVAAIQFAVALLHAREYVAIFEFSAGVSTLRKAIGEGTQLFTLDLSEFMIMQGTIWLATAVFSPAVATQYAAALTLAMQVTILESLSALAVAAPAARLWAAGKKEEVVRMLSNAATLSTLVVIIVVALLAVFGRFVVEVAYGPSMRPAATMLLILATGGIVQASCQRSNTMLIVSGSITAAARTAILVLIVALPCAVAAALLSGPIALAVVTSLSVAAISTGQWLTARKILGRAPHAHYRIVRAARELASDPDAKAEPCEVK
jgi:O-antigen/teichoic acid export membrane protein